MKQRKAIKRSSEIVAECPLEGTCTCKMEGKKEWQRCGYYDGTVEDLDGLRVICKYQEQ
jgi:hypothetical protein